MPINNLSYDHFLTPAFPFTKGIFNSLVNDIQNLSAIFQFTNLNLFIFLSLHLENPTAPEKSERDLLKTVCVFCYLFMNK